jgi:hypothetical protein
MKFGVSSGTSLMTGERAIRAGEYSRTLSELDDAVTKLKRLADQL